MHFDALLLQVAKEGAEEVGDDVSEAFGDEAGAAGANLADDLHELMSDQMDAAEVIYKCMLTWLTCMLALLTCIADLTLKCIVLTQTSCLTTVTHMHLCAACLALGILAAWSCNAM